MKNERFQNYLLMGLAAFLVIAASLLTAFLLFHFSAVRSMVQTLTNILMPFIIGCVIAYLLAPIYNLLLRNIECSLVKRKLPAVFSRKVGVMLSVFLSIAAALWVISGLVALVVPSLVNSCMVIMDSMQSYMDTVNNWINTFFEESPELAETVEYYLNAGSEYLMKWATENLLPSLQGLTGSVGTGVGNMFSVLFSGVLVAFKVVKNLIIGFIVAAYLLIGKDSMIAHSKLFLFGVFKLNTANRIIARSRYVHQVFGGFIRGKLLDSLLIGLLCFVGTSLLKIPYAMLVSVIIGVTNIIPFFGPFIGAVPCAVLVLLNNPVKCLTFIIFVLAVQQFDGNILGPRILGDSTGLSPFWVLFSIILFGGLFGFVGMIIGVPVFAVLVSVLEGFLNDRLKARNMSVDVEDYKNLARIEEKNGVRIYAKMRDPTKKEPD